MLCPQSGGVSERPKEHAWKACKRDKRFVGSNPTSSELLCCAKTTPSFKRQKMRCPFCNHEELKVTDSRNATESNAIRRRRECLNCQKRFTTFETVDLVIQVRKRDGRYEDFEQEKLIKGLDAACRHTRVSREQVRALAYRISMELLERQIREIETTELGEIVMKHLQTLDTVAYIRFACVYRRFKDVDELKDAIEHVKSEEAHATEKIGD